jgi:hypothetical protein
MAIHTPNNPDMSMKPSYTKLSLVWVLLYCLSFANSFATISSEEKGKEKDKPQPKPLKSEKPKDKNFLINPIVHIRAKPLKTSFGYVSPNKKLGADPFLFSIIANKDYADVGEEIELTVKVTWADFGVNNGVRFLPEWYNYTLKVVMPKGFTQTGGDYTDYCTKLVDAQNQTATFTIKGQFEFNTNDATFTVLRGFEGADNKSEFIYKTEKKFIVNRNLAYNSEMGIGLSNPKIQPNFLPREKPKTKSSKTAGDDCEARAVYEDMEDLDLGENIAPQGWIQDNGLDVQPSGQVNMFDKGIKRYLNQAQEPDLFYYPTIPYNTTANTPNQVLGFASTGGVSVYKESITNKFLFTVGKQYYLEFEQAVVANTSKNDKPYFEIQIGSNAIRSTPMSDYNGFVKQRFGPFTFTSTDQIVKITGVATSYYSYMLLDNFNVFAYAGNNIVRTQPLPSNSFKEILDEACLMIELKPGFDTATNPVGTKNPSNYQEYRTKLHGQK